MRIYDCVGDAVQAARETGRPQGAVIFEVEHGDPRGNFAVSVLANPVGCYDMIGYHGDYFDAVRGAEYAANLNP